MNRTISPLTLSLLSSMASDPQTPPKLAKFYADSLADLQRRAARQQEPKPSPFSRFEAALEIEHQSKP